MQSTKVSKTHGPAADQATRHAGQAHWDHMVLLTTHLDAYDKIAYDKIAHDKITYDVRIL